LGTLAGLPHGCDPQRLGLDAGQITGVVCLHRRHGHAVYRVRYGSRSFVLKWFPAPDGAWPQPPAWAQQDVRRRLARGGLARLIRRALDVL
jgi:hypothetical protein